MKNNLKEWIIAITICMFVFVVVLFLFYPRTSIGLDPAYNEQAISTLNKIDERIYDTLASTGNKRKTDLKITKGMLTIDPINDRIFWEIESEYQFSEVGTKRNAGKITFETFKKDPWITTFTLEIPFDLRYNNDNTQLKTFEENELPYPIIIESHIDENNKTIINIYEAS